MMMYPAQRMGLNTLEMMFMKVRKAWDPSEGLL